ncbi:MAG: idi [Ilumatobacteraceae bacterium]|nr:idi [Ilumatobacteraceae bacterium]
MMDGDTSLLAASTAARTTPNDHVVLLDASGRPRGSADKATVHSCNTPLHLAVSCYVVRDDGKLLLSRRAAAKRTWPGVWTNACCGHPRPGEPITDAVRRHLRDELGLRPRRLRVALPDFAYRATMRNGIVEHELCPVHIAECDIEPVLDPDEADAAEWLSWAELIDRAEHSPESLSPWSVTQIERMSAFIDDPLEWVRREPIEPSPMPIAEGLAGLEHVARRVESVLDQFLRERELELTALDRLAAELCAPIRSLFGSGGKRLRPYIVHLGHQAVRSIDDDTDVVHAAAAVEMLHTFALLHDDVMDRSVLRRGSPTAHVQLGDLHRTTRIGGDAEWFGVSAAIVAGDLAFVWADQLLERMMCSTPTRERVRAAYDVLRHEVVVGQYLDLRLAGPCATDHQAQNVALLKSGRYTLTRPLELGAALAGGSTETVEVLRCFGDAAGVAFQLRDDVLGVFGESALTGKGACDDIRSGKASLLLVRAMELARPQQRDVLRAGLGNDALDADGVERCREAVRDSGALASIEALIDAKLAEACDVVASLPAGPRRELVSLADMLGHRQS